MLSTLVVQLTELLDEASVETDPAMIRLFPDAYAGAPEDAAEFRRLTEPDLRDRKRDNAGQILAAISAPVGDVERTRFTLDEAQALAWLRSLADLRLVLASRLGILTDDDEGDGDPLTIDIYRWLAYLQEHLVAALEKGLT
jgi:Domain of unknown function (DUF2017)